MTAPFAGAAALEPSLRAAFDEIPMLVWCNLPDGTSDFCNKRWHDYTGINPREARGWGWQLPFHPDDLPRLIENWAAIRERRKPAEFEARLCRNDGVFRWFACKMQPSRDPCGNVLRWFAASTDIDDLKTAELKAIQYEETVNRIIDLIPQTILVLSATGRVIYANKSVLDVTGLSPDEVRAEDFGGRILHPDDAEHLLGRVGNRVVEAVVENELRVRGKDGRFRPFLVRCIPLPDEGGNVVRWCATGMDIEGPRRAEYRIQTDRLVPLRHIDMPGFEEIVGASRALKKVLANLAKVAPTDTTVLIRGETGTGKDLVARAIHNRSKRAGRAFIRVNCAAIPPSLIASELFGYEKGAFTGALQRRSGRFEAANGGTLFLDEIGELRPETQIALLRVLQEREFERIGGNDPVPVDVRILAATNRDLNAAVDDGLFRSDLFYRLNVFPIDLPALRNRADDIPLLVEYMVDRCAKKVGKTIRSIHQETLEQLQRYHWPGNIRELQNIVERGVIVCESGSFHIDPTWLKPTGRQYSKRAVALPSDLVKREKTIIETALRESAGRVSGKSGAAARLGLSRQTLEAKIRKFGIQRHRFGGLNGRSANGS